jgi:hypothetical protein
MSDKRTSIEVDTARPSYVGWRGKLLAELALARLPQLTVYPRPERPASDLPYDVLVVAEHGLCFFVVVRAFSSFHLDVRDVAAVPELRCSFDADLVRRSRASQSPCVLFLFDADRDHGRYLRLDTLPDPGPESRRLTVRFPAEQAITRESLGQFIAGLQKAPAA